MGKEIQPTNSQLLSSGKRQRFDKAFKLNAVQLLQAGQTPATQLALVSMVKLGIVIGNTINHFNFACYL